MTPTPRRIFFVGAIVVGAASFISPAHADSVGFARFQELVRAAASDEKALAQLRAVDEIDGRTVDVAAALDGAEGQELRARLQALVATTAPPSLDPDAYRQEAREILSARRYDPPDAPRPLEGIARRVGEWFRPVIRFFERIAVDFPGGGRALWLLLATAVVTFATIVAIRTGSRRTALGGADDTRRSAAREEDAGSLERSADRAEASGDFVTAIRLRFQAGLLRLGQAGVIELSPSTTAGQVARALRSRVFASLAWTFEQVTYGGRPAHRDEAEAARSGWAHLRAEYVRR